MLFRSGAAALLASQAKGKRPFDYKEVKEWILAGAKPLPSNENHEWVSSGLLSIPGSLAQAVKNEVDTKKKLASPAPAIALVPVLKSKKKFRD